MAREAPTRWDVLLAHAVRSWEAEVGNAERLAARVNLVITIILAVAGVGLFKVVLDPLASPLKPRALNATLLVTNLTGLVFLAIAFLMLLGVLRGRTGTPSERVPTAKRVPTASYFLLPEHALLQELTATPPRPADEGVYLTYRAFVRTTEGAFDLATRNWDEKRRIDRGQQWFLIGLGLLLVSSLAYTGLKGSEPGPPPNPGARAQR